MDVSKLLSRSPMNNNTPESWFRYHLIVLFLLIAGSSASIIIIENSGSESLYWPGWYILSFSDEIELTNADELLVNAGVSGALSAANTGANYMAIPKIDHVKLTNLDEVLVPGDPRRDPYISRLHKLFESGSNALIYLPADRSLRSYRNLLEGIDDFAAWQLMDYQGEKFQTVPLIIFITIALLIAFFIGTGPVSYLRIAAILPLAILVSTGGTNMVFPALLVYFLSPGYFRRVQLPARRLYLILLYAGIAAVVAAVFQPAFIIAVLSSELIYLLFAKSLDKEKVLRKSKKPKLRRKSDHQLFDPLSLMQPVHKHISRISLHTAAVFLITTAVILTFLLPGAYHNSETHAPIPYTAVSLEGFESMNSIQRLNLQHNGNSLPDVSDMLASAAFQEGFLYGAEYGLPLIGDSLLFRRYLGIDNGISVRDSTITLYDEDWYEEVLSRELNNGAGRLYKSVGGPSGIKTVSQLPGIEETYPNSIQIVLYSIAVMVMMLLTLFPLRHKKPARSIYKPISTTRRRAQAA
ncbi:MAG: hypothetical protein KAH21_09635 [Spirochaetaceae bacterium]|nr:hypothetical protein [Spirochaetaceae bacterium]